MDAVDAGLGELAVRVGRTDDAEAADPSGAGGEVGAGQDVVELPAGQAFDAVETVTQSQVLLGGEDWDTEVGVGGIRVALVDGPVEAEHAVVALNAGHPGP